MIRFLARHAALLLALGVTAGLALPELATPLRPLVTPSVWGLLLLAMLRIEWASVRQALARPRAVALAIIWMLGVTPLLVAGVARGLDLGEGPTLALSLAACSAPIMSSPALALMLGLDAALVLVTMIPATLLLPLTAPPLAVALLGLDVGAGVLELALRLGGFVASAALIAASVRRACGAARLAAAEAPIDAALVILMILFAIGIMDGMNARLIAEPKHMLGLAAGAFLLNLGLQAVTFLAFLPLGRAPALALGYAAGNRNLAILLAVLPLDIHPDVPAFLALGQLPIYLLPWLMRPCYRRLLRG